ncbi:hypothetical protein FPV67DRAFT_1486879 [Lyophyllum atratum]|nr:hypothetical protein FPV67DRAFT_1486879 [Lyophyllum atratum]
MPAVERARLIDMAQIPRPPNSWILYRSDMVALLPPPPPGTTRSQAEVSRIISTMWRTETLEVKAEYDRRAEVKKLEHAAMYPHYRYMPKSKELKEEIKREKEEKKKNKRKKKKEEEIRQAPASSRPFASRGPTPSLPPLTSLPFPFLTVDQAYYGQGGPSPPMSAAASPSPEPVQPIDTPTVRANEQAASNQNAYPHYRPHTVAAPQAQPQYPIHAQPDYQPTPTHHYRTTSGDSQVEQNAVYYPQQQYQQPQDPQANQAVHGQDQQYAFVQNASQQGDASSPQDYLSFDLQQFAGQSLATWAMQNAEFQPTLDQFLNNTSGDCYQMQINPPDQHNLGEEAVGPLEVEVGQMGDFDFSQLSWDDTTTLNMGSYQSFLDTTLTQNGGFESMAGPSSHASPAEGSGQPSADVDQGFRFEQFVNFDPTFDYIPPTPIIEQAPDVAEHTPYAPPAGAAHSNKRRVAASWNASFAMNDPIDV